MIIKVTEIEASAEDLAESSSLGDALRNFLLNAIDPFAVKPKFDGDDSTTMYTEEIDHDD